MAEKTMPCVGDLVTGVWTPQAYAGNMEECLILGVVSGFGTTPDEGDCAKVDILIQDDGYIQEDVFMECSFKKSVLLPPQSIKSVEGNVRVLYQQKQVELEV